MQFVAEAILPTYLEALQRALDNAVQRLPQGAPRRILTRLRSACPRGRRAGSSPACAAG